MKFIPGSSRRIILLLEDEYPSNVYTWKRLAEDQGGVVRFVARPSDGDWTSAILEALDGDVGLASLAHNHWMDGALVDLEQIGNALRCGAYPARFSRHQRL